MDLFFSVSNFIARAGRAIQQPVTTGYSVHRCSGRAAQRRAQSIDGRGAHVPHGGTSPRSVWALLLELDSGQHVAHFDLKVFLILTTVNQRAGIRMSI